MFESSLEKNRLGRIGAGDETAGLALLRCGMLDASICACPRSAKLDPTDYRVCGLGHSNHSKSPHNGGLFEWCKIVDAFQTSAIDAQDDYKLKHLVEVFNLSGDLIT